MDKDWVALMDLTDPLRATILIGMLQANGLRALNLDQIDTAYQSFGNITIYVHREDIVKARYLIENPSDEGSTA